MIIEWLFFSIYSIIYFSMCNIFLERCPHPFLLKEGFYFDPSNVQTIISIEIHNIESETHLSFNNWLLIVTENEIGSDTSLLWTKCLIEPLNFLFF